MGNRISRRTAWFLRSARPAFLARRAGPASALAAVTLVVASWAVNASSASQTPPEPPTPAAVPLSLDVPTCMRVSTEARYRPYGYDHVVRLESSCEEAARCSIATDANPVPTGIIVRARDTAEVVTFVGSPARAFSVSVDCQLLGAS